MTTDDLQYLGIDQGFSWITQALPARVLISGELDSGHSDLLEALNTELRQLPPGQHCRELHEGVYGILRRGRWEALVVTSGKGATASASARHRFTDDGPSRHLGLARDALIDQWEDGVGFLGSSPFAVNDIVKIRGTNRIGKVLQVVRTASGHRIRVVVDGEHLEADAHSITKVDGDPRSPDFWIQEEPSGAKEIALTLTWTKLRQPLSNTLYSYKASKTIFRAYQFIPALKMLSSPTGRLLIADEVGLGKTIEAGLIWSELEQRAPLRRTLVVAPSSLALKWRMEMSRRFDRNLDIIKPARLLELADDMLEGKEPELHAVISLESLRTANEALDRLSEIRPRFDLIVVDEAHALRNIGTKSNLMGGLLSDWADHLLFLSATPINLRNDDLYNLLTLLDEGLFQDKEVFQLQLEPNRHLNAVARSVTRGEPGNSALTELRAIQDLELGTTVTARPDFARLEALLQGHEPLDHAARSEVKRLVAELNTLSSVLTRTRKIDVPDDKAVREPHQIEVHWEPAEKEFYDSVVAHFMSRALATGTPPGFAMQMPLRQAASCLPAMERHLAMRDADEFLTGIDDVDEELSPGEFALSLDAPRAPRLARDSKFEALRERLLHLRAQGVKQAMIFSTFRGTIAYLVDRLRDDFSVQQLHGGIPMQDRQPIIDAFRDGRFELLVASEVASEGLDFEFCNVLVNYDLPWNPMRVEQRIGRLDRFGQKNEKILVLNMHVPGTIETDILERLYSRIGIFSNSIGDLEPILRDEFRDVTNQLLDPTLTPAQRQRRADEIAVAIEHRAATLQKLQEQTATLSTVEQLAVEGMSGSGPSDGRYIGESELRLLVDNLVRGTGGSLSQADREGIHVLRGTPALSDLIWRLQSKNRGSRPSAVPFQARIRNADPIAVTFDADLASTRDVELLSVRHPLVELGLAYLEEESLRLRRYGLVEVPRLPAGKRYAVRVDLVEQTGIRPLRELWATAINAETRLPEPDVGGELLTALADGSLRDCTWGSRVDMTSLLSALEEAVWAQRSREEPRRRLDNEAMAQGRRDAREASLRIKLHKGETTLALVMQDRRDPRVIRMHQGRIRNIRQDIDNLHAEFARQRDFAMTLKTVALVEVTGPAI